MRSAWNVNRSLYPDQFEALDAAITQRGPSVAPRYDAADLLALVTGGESVGEFLELELGQISDEFNRAAFVCVLGRVLTYADENVAEQLLRIPGARAMGTEVDALISEMRSAAGFQSGPLEQTADLIHGSARVVALLRQGNSAAAAELAEAVTWPRTRRALLCAVYGCARSMGDSPSAARAHDLALQV